jgi:hypothetical protein
MNAATGLDRYLAELERRLGGLETAPAIVDEVRDHLLEAVRAHTTHGLGDSTAVERALDEFGAPRRVAAEFLAVRCHRESSRLQRDSCRLGLLFSFPGFAAWLFVPALATGTLRPDHMPALTAAEWAGRLSVAGLIAAVLLARVPSHRLTGRWLVPLLATVTVLGWFTTLDSFVYTGFFAERVAAALGAAPALPSALVAAGLGGVTSWLVIRPQRVTALLGNALRAR